MSAVCPAHTDRPCTQGDRGTEAFLAVVGLKNNHSAGLMLPSYPVFDDTLQRMQVLRKAIAKAKLKLQLKIISCKDYFPDTPPDQTAERLVDMLADQLRVWECFGSHLTAETALAASRALPEGAYPRWTWLECEHSRTSGKLIGEPSDLFVCSRVSRYRPPCVLQRSVFADKPLQCVSVRYCSKGERGSRHLAGPATLARSLTLVCSLCSEHQQADWQRRERFCKAPKW